MRILFTIAIFLSSFLLFLIEPMIAKMILPRFGGSPGVWNTSLLFFQAALLAGYGYAHLATKWLGPRTQALTHLLVLLLPLLVLPVALPAGIESGEGNPALLVLLILTISVGLPFLVVSAGAPLLQRWFGATDDPHAHDPYFLYSASNVGSMLGLFAYPFLIEPQFGLSRQTRLWTYGYVGLIVLMAACIGALWFHRGKGEPIHEAPPTMPPEVEGTASDSGESIGWKRRLLWIGLAFCPSSLLLGVTTYLTSNIAPIPLLWVVPLALYLITFIVAFARRRLLSGRQLGRFMPLLVVPLSFTIVLEASEPAFMVALVTLHLLVFFGMSLLCHTELADSRPKAEHLTEFFFYVSLGGVVGGVFNALIAPTLFNSYFEYPLVLAVACYFRPRPTGWKLQKMDWIYPAALFLVSIVVIAVAKEQIPDPTPLRSGITIGIPLVLAFIAVDRPVRFALSLAAFFTVTSVMQIAVVGRIVEAKRSFFGVHRVQQAKDRFGLFRTLVHGNTVHGMENFGGPYAGLPLTYYEQSGPIGQVFEALGPSRKSVAVVGLGVGSLAYYGRPGQGFTYYEIDPDVVQLARDSGLFTFLRDCKANLQIKVGDARIELKKAQPDSYDLIVLDAFSSDSIPMHLLTREAIEMYLAKLMPHGVLAFHISNRYLDLAPVLGNEAAALGLKGLVEEDPDHDAETGKYASIWVVMARSSDDFGPLQRQNLAWETLAPDPAKPLWTDDYSSIVGIIHLHHTGED